MRPLQNALAIIATFFAAGALLPWNGRLRLLCACIAAGLIAVLFVLRMQSHAASAARRSGAAVDAKIAQIRAERGRRMGRRR